MSDIEYLKKKRLQVLEAITPICEAFGIDSFDYIVQTEGQRETLVLNGQKIGCSCNSIMAVIDEVIGYLFITRFCRHRSIGAFSTQTQNRIKCYWIGK